MMATTLVKDVLYRVSTLLQDASPQFTRWTEKELIAWLNDGQKAIAKYLPSSCSRVDSMKLRKGTLQSIDQIPTGGLIDLYGSLSAYVVNGLFFNDAIRNMGADGKTPGKSIRLVSREVLDSQNPMWHSIKGAGVVDQFVFDPRTPKSFYVFPAVDTVDTWIEISYLSQPVDVANVGTPGNSKYLSDGSNTQTINIDDRFVDDLVNYIVARAYMKDADFAMNAQNAQAYQTMFLSSLNAQVAAVTGSNPNLQAMPMNPAIPAAAK